MMKKTPSPKSFKYMNKQQKIDYVQSMSVIVDSNTGRTAAHESVYENPVNERDFPPEILALSEKSGWSVAHALAQKRLLDVSKVPVEIANMSWNWKNPETGESFSLTVTEVAERSKEWWRSWFLFGGKISSFIASRDSSTM